MWRCGRSRGPSEIRTRIRVGFPKLDGDRRLFDLLGAWEPEA